MVKKILTIAGSDCSGGAGIEADIKTITAHKMYAMSTVTSLTAQNTTGVYGIFEVPPEFLVKQLDCIFTDIKPDAVKIGMMPNSDIIIAIAERLSFYKAANVVTDTVMASTSGARLLGESSLDTLIKYIFPVSSVITPNIPEAEALCGARISSKDDMVKAAEYLCGRFKVPVLIKGGHLLDSADDILCKNGVITEFSSPRINNPNTHGTGCTLSSAIACNLALGLSLCESVGNAKEYLSGAVSAGLCLGKGPGPLFHAYLL